MATAAGTRRKQGSPSFVTFALLLGWIVVIVAAAGVRPKEAPLLGVAHGGTIVGIVMVVLALCGLALLIYLRPASDGEALPPYRRRQPWFFLALVVLVFWLWQPDGFEFGTQEAAESADSQDPAEQFTFDAEPAAETVAQMHDLLLVGLVVAALGCIVYWSRRRIEEANPMPVDEPDDRFESDVAIALDQASTELRLGDDPRSAVIAAYATLEEVLSSHDRSRAPSETPHEHLRRAIGTLGIEAASLDQLGELYSLARFSEQPITVDQQQRAYEALERSRAEVGARR